MFCFSGVERSAELLSQETRDEIEFWSKKMRSLLDNRIGKKV
ncbi:hypothetical protein NC99_01260 [Sunxiuqinia dokdonensis]|uniref:Uncharacterized protein n=1 Tax=Sunxiuqinia dokdonensis TaxID=1409788 RepID=A0A0L8VFC7_9BACT|nr:hypothetical protein NC99_01260 [Sunxiuqinia dokdonensis]